MPSTGGMKPGRIEDKLVDWLKHNYDNGLILVSATKHDPQMLLLGYDYKTYIHEGAGYYWKESIIDPSKYAKWVIMDYNNQEDLVTKNLKNSKILSHKFQIVYDDHSTRIYKKSNK